MNAKKGTISPCVITANVREDHLVCFVAHEWCPVVFGLSASFYAQTMQIPPQLDCSYDSLASTNTSLELVVSDLLMAGTLFFKSW